MSDVLERGTSTPMDPELADDPQLGSSAPPPVFKHLLPGDPLPWLMQATSSRQRFAFDTLAGRYQLFCFFMNADGEVSRAALRAVSHRRRLFDDLHCSFIGVTISKGDEGRGVGDLLPGVRFAFDFDLRMSQACGAASMNAKAGSPVAIRRFWMLVDPSLHVLKLFPFDAATVDEVLDAVSQLVEPDRFGGVSRPAPILLLPNVFEPELCTKLIRAYDDAGGSESGVHRDGQGVLDATFKRRKDYTLVDTELLTAVNNRIARRVLPEIEKLFFMKAAYIERHIVGCYSAADGGHFSPHRDNREGLTAHRRFAISINLNAAFAGGEVVFPEYNMQGYKAPSGWAVVFPCAILHQVKPVTAGARYAFLPFVYDDAGRAIRDAEVAKRAVVDEAEKVGQHRSDAPDLSAETI